MNLEAAERHTSSIAEDVTSTWEGKVVGAFGGFAAGVGLPPGYRDPVLMMTTDGVGTKLELARRHDMWDGIGFDLVAMCVDDLVAAGARPIGLVDYMAVGSLRQDRDRRIVASVAAACRVAGCPLLGGETAEHPGVMEPDTVDLAGAAMGVVERGDELGPHKVHAGDLLVGLESPNLRSNGYSLVRSVLGGAVDDHVEILLEPSVIYAPRVLEAVERGGIGAAAHITGGGLAGNLGRILPTGLAAVVDTSRWTPPPVFTLIESQGVDREEMLGVFNMGIGFCLVVSPDALESVMSITATHQPVVVGEIEAGDGVRFV